MDYIKLLRPLQWSKNFFVFLPIFFAQGITDISRLWLCVVAFILMSLASSSIYILNDICDVKYDRNHPEKSKRPIASGRVSVAQAVILYLLLILSVVAIVWFLLPIPNIAWAIGIYLVINHLYSFKLKHISILDVMIVSSGFVIRVLIGAFAANVVPSHWIIVMTFLLALFLVLAKRRDDVLKFEKTATSTRRNVKSYNRNFLDNTITLVAAITLVSYLMYTVDDEIVLRLNCNYVYSTAIFVLAGILRYMQIIFVESRGSSPTKIIINDRFIQVCVIGWLALFAFIIYG